MCGIVGRINAASDKPVSREELCAATRSLVHRGPDGEGLYCKGRVGLGHRRLSIVDIAGGAQPMASPEGRLSLVFNGEIYNHEALRAELRARGYRFTTRSDTEVILHGYDAWGDQVTTRLQGMFAFALWDERRQRLLVARDRVGIKPLYWTQVGGDLLFASEVKALLRFPDVPRLLESSLVPEFLALRYVPGPDTLFRGIFRLQPGHQLTLQGGQVRIERYWDVPLEAWRETEGRRDLRGEAEHLNQLFQRTVREHLMGEVPVGVFLSGGLDSSAVTWAMRQAAPSVLKSFSIGYEDTDGELGYAREVARALGTQHREVRLGAAEFADNMERLVWHLDEPNADIACIPLMVLSRRAREEVTVVLSGEGADELFAGYGMYPRTLAMERARSLGGSALAAASGLGLRVVRDVRVRKYLDMLRRPLEGRYFGIGRGFTDELLVEAFGAPALERLAARFEPLWERTQGQPLLHRLLYNDTKVWLPDDLLIKADRMSMSAAIELRVPFLDHVLLESAWRLPPELKLRGGVGKFLLREAVGRQLPRTILERPKQGFPVPLTGWLRGSLHAACREQLLAGGGVVRDLVGTSILTRLLDEHRTGRANRTEELYSLWVLDGWYRGFIAQRSGAHDAQELRSPPGLFDRNPEERRSPPAASAGTQPGTQDGAPVVDAG